MKKYKLKYHILSENCLEISWPQAIDPNIVAEVRQLEWKINQHLNELVHELVPTYASVAVFFNSNRMSHQELSSRIDILNQRESKNLPTSKKINIPICYDEEFGIDQSRICKFNNLDVETLIRLHYEQHYLIYMTGFLPGFVYMGEINNKIKTPRLPDPRRPIYPGSVGIAESQTGIYGLESPGGWNILGRTPKIFIPSNDQATPTYQQGDTVFFYQISKDEYRYMLKHQDG